MKKPTWVVGLTLPLSLAACAPTPEAEGGPLAWLSTDNPAAASGEDFVAAPYDAIPDSERDARRAFFAEELEVHGTVVDSAGNPLAAATVTLGEDAVVTDELGRFQLRSDRTNKLLRVEAEGYYSHIAGAQLCLPLASRDAPLGTMRLTRREAGLTRFLFGGDTSFGRRFLDPLERFTRWQVPEPHPDALIDVDDPLPGSRDVLSRMSALFQSVDFPVVNLETVMTRNPETPHEEKDFAYFSLPESLPALTELGVQYVSLGNNHVYDYLELGILDTFAALDAAGLQHSGAGSNSDQAFGAYRQDLAGHPYSFLSMTSVSGDRFATTYYATDVKGGAADLRDDEKVAAAIQRERAAGRFPIVQMHTGREYSYSPIDYVLGRFALVAAERPALIIGHHPHVAQGFAYHDGILAVHSLGNFLFDQLRMDTMLSMMVSVDLAGEELRGAKVFPIYVEDSVPRLLSGPTAARFLRRIGEASSAHGAVVLPGAGHGEVRPELEQPALVTRSVSLQVDVGASGFAVVDLRQLAAADESLSRLGLPAGATARLGRDLLEGHGDFEDIDVDAEILELSRWDVTGASSFPCLSVAHRGAAAACSVRSAGHQVDSVIALRNRVRVLGDVDHAPNKDVSLLGYLKGENAGDVRIEASFLASIGEAAFGKRVVYQQAGGSYDWHPVLADIAMPEENPDHLESFELNARALRIFLHHAAPAKGDALVAFDDIAIVNWDLPLKEAGLHEVAFPHARDFVRVDAPAGAYELELELTGYDAE
jgi:poly-gamma-glutamate capsule biosynthesis protein CapA/YwtB (metallophosphatase superfamily)